jgi:thioredoxin
MDTFRCAVCEAFTEMGEPTQGVRCKACESVLDLSGRPHPVDAAALARAVEQSPVPLLVDFWAPWCGPCVWSAPIVKAIGARMAGKIVVLTLNTAESPEAGEQHAIYAVPTFALFRGGEELSRQIGLRSRADLEDWIRASVVPRAISVCDPMPRIVSFEPGAGPTK